MRIVSNPGGECLIILKDNGVFRFVGVRPQRAPAQPDPSMRERASLSSGVLAAWAGIAGSLQRGARFRRSA